MVSSGNGDLKCKYAGQNVDYFVVLMQTTKKLLFHAIPNHYSAFHYRLSSLSNVFFFFNFISRLEDRQLKKEKTYNITILS